MSFEKSQKILNLTIQNNQAVNLESFLVKTDKYWQINLLSAGVLIEDKRKRAYHVAVFLDDSIGEIQLGNFIIPSGAYSYNFSPPWKTINTLRSQNFDEVKLRFEINPLDNHLEKPVLKFGYINLELNAGSELVFETTRKALDKKRKTCGK
jgi:hypothetical protein